jgi:FKBP-type peptidyl-prolyl cis-trans isomerase
MKVIRSGCLAYGLCVIAAQAQDGSDRPDLTEVKQKVSYALGAHLASNLKQHDLDADVTAMMSGLTDTLAGKPRLTDQELRAALEQLQREIVTKGQRRHEATAAENLKKTKDFLAVNAKKPGIKSTGSGLQYEVLKSGSGPTPTRTDTVTAEFKSLLSDGQALNHPGEKSPRQLRVNGVLSGVSEPLQAMKVGDKWRLFIPPHLAYGEDGYPPRFPPNSVLVFELELLGIEEAKQPGK